MPKFIRRGSPSSPAGGAGAAPAPCPVTSPLPALVEFLTCGEWEPGKRRELGSLLVVWQDGRWRGWLNDRDGSRSAWLSDETLTGLLASLDEGLREERLEWRRDKKDRQKGGGK